jgi:hypothetical protein
MLNKAAPMVQYLEAIDVALKVFQFCLREPLNFSIKIMTIPSQGLRDDSLEGFSRLDLFP